MDDLRHTRLFAGMEPGEIGGLLVCLGARRAQYLKGEFIIEEGDRVSEFGIVLSGRGRSIIWDPSDKLVTITLLEKGGEIGIMLVASPEHRSPVAVQAITDMSVLRVPFARLMMSCAKACPRHGRLLRNYIGIVAERGLLLHERIDCLLKTTVREKIMAYLTRLSREQGGAKIKIPMNRNAMAEYLNVERSALSRELSRMKRDGLIDYHLNAFVVLQEK